MKSTDWDKISKRYDKEISSPLDQRVRNPLYAELKKIKGPENKSVLEVGCGLGRLAPLLAKNYKQVLCTDFSKKMIEQAEAHHQISNVTFKVKDMTKLGSLKHKFDVVVSVNSIIMPSIVEVDKALKQIHKCLKKKGTFLGIFPALDSDVYRASLTFDREYRISKNEAVAIKDTKIILSQSSYDLMMGFYRNHGKQKHYFRSDLEFRLLKAGFKKLEFKKVEYPWSMAEDKFKGKDLLWDWLVIAQGY